MRREALLLAAGLSLLARGAAAQCADGSRPPCREDRAPVRATVKLDPQTWIVLPFENLAKDAEVEWLHEASVNLLYADLSRWQDVRAIDDRRVADFVRELPAPRRAARLTVADGQEIARRAGAGKLVMGEVLKIGNTTRVTASAYDARTGTRIRSSTQQTTIKDSLMSLFGRVAGELLAVPPPTGANVGAAGTSRADAYQEYVAGTAALNRFDIAEAKQHLEKALALDSTFALAHYKLAIASIYDEVEQSKRDAAQALAGPAARQPDTTRLSHANAAVRLSTSLPPRERALISGLRAQIRREYPRACELYGSLIAPDSTDVEALYGYGECSYLDDQVDWAAGDSTRPRFRSSWNSTLRVLRRAIAVDATYHLAFDRILDVLQASTRRGCHHVADSVPCLTARDVRYNASVRRDGDSLVTIPSRQVINILALVAVTDAERSGDHRLKLEQARAAAETWVAAGPREGRAHRALGSLLLRLGRFADAERELGTANGLLPHDDYSDLPLLLLDARLKLGRDAEVMRMIDSMTAAQKTDYMRANVGMVFGPLTGRLAQSDSALGFIMKGVSNAGRGSLPPLLMQYMQAGTRIGLGVSSDSMARLEAPVRQQFGAGTRCTVTCPVMFQTAFMLGLLIPRASWPVFDTTITDRRYAPAAAMGAGDTTRLRRAARMLDSVSREGAKNGLPEEGSGLVAADAYLLLRDSVAALKVLNRLADTTLVNTPIAGMVVLGSMVMNPTLWPRVLLQRGDVAAALGDRAAARASYKRFLTLWAKSDPEFKPLMDRVRKAYAASGGT